MNKLSRSIAKWTEVCDKRLKRLISYIHHTCDNRQYCHVGNTAKQCRLGLFQDSDFAGDREDSKSTSGGSLCIFGSHTFVPISWMCKKQTAVSHSSTGSEIISLDTVLRLDGLPALELWDLIVSVLGNVSRAPDRSGKPESDDHKHHKFHNKIDVNHGPWASATAPLAQRGTSGAAIPPLQSTWEKQFASYLPPPQATSAASAYTALVG